MISHTHQYKFTHLALQLIKKSLFEEVIDQVPATVITFHMMCVQCEDKIFIQT